MTCMYANPVLSNAPRLNAQNLTALCTPNCLSSLNSAKTAIQSACTLPGDVMSPDYGSYPATFLVDLFIYTYGMNCHRDACVASPSPREKQAN